MKKLSIFQKLIYFITVVLALLLLLACVIPYFPVKLIPLFSFISLGVPALVVLNILFAIYWVFASFKRSLFLIFALVVGYLILGSFVQFRGESARDSKEDLKIMTFNSYGFQGLGGKNDKAKEKENGINIIHFISKQNPDIICFQEFDYKRIRSGELDAYPYSYVDFEFGEYRERVVQAIYSKFPIVSKGNLNFPKSHNNGIYADILYEKDTLRIYNLHLESLGITPGKGVLSTKPPEKLYKQLGDVFKKQEEQALLVSEHARVVNFKKIICGDFNNGQYSRIYNLIRGNLKDTFEEKGSGYGRTFNFHGLPIRIDFILAEEELKVKSHKNFDVKYSDHFPVMASFSLE
ncbi:endonuclease/exonuclease/phosphatase family protein [uncultured Maribacter sp.]|uniref:endonuclease/exonuclease/phosphatase family protein n=1 Tax=uncultured Maribacter sp. TaxID=431308 RepID=UPI002637B63B|nr:endonuclease/exonuclease/phosphatase family protein [uncultured Maribacter sp.]